MSLLQEHWDAEVFLSPLCHPCRAAVTIQPPPRTAQALPLGSVCDQAVPKGEKTAFKTLICVFWEGWCPCAPGGLLSSGFGQCRGVWGSQGTGDDPHLPSIPSKITLPQHLALPRGVSAPKEDGKVD